MVLVPVHPYTYYLGLKQRHEGFCLCKDSATYARSWEKDDEVNAHLFFWGVVLFCFFGSRLYVQ